MLVLGDGTTGAEMETNGNLTLGWMLLPGIEVFGLPLKGRDTEGPESEPFRSEDTIGETRVVREVGSTIGVVVSDGREDRELVDPLEPLDCPRVDVVRAVGAVNRIEST